MDYLIEWIRAIAIFHIVSTLVLSVVPDNNYKKYIKLFVGLMTVLLIFKPVISLCGMDKKFEKNYLLENINVMQEDLKNQIIIAGDKQYELIRKEYEEQIAENIRAYTESIGAIYVDSNIEFGYQADLPEEEKGRITSLNIRVKRGNAYHSEYINYESNTDEEMLAAKIKNYFSKLYNMDIRNIHIHISDE